MVEHVQGEVAWSLPGLPGVGTYEWWVAEDKVIWSAGLAALYGVAEGPDCELDFSRLVHPDDRTRVQAETSAFLEASDSYSHAFRIVRPDGEVRFIHDRGVIERFADGRPRVFRGLNVDVTDDRKPGGGARDLRMREERLRAAAELERRANQQRLELAYEASEMGAWDLDLTTRRSVWSPRLYALLGVPDDLPASSDLFFEKVHPDDQDELVADFEAAIRTRETFDRTFRIVRPNGQVRFVAGRGRVVEERDGRPVRMIGVNFDVTRLMETEERLIQSADRLRLLMREVNHRSKNMLSLVLAIARLSSPPRQDDFLPRFEARVMALARAQDLLVRREWAEIPFEDLVRTQLGHLSDLFGTRILLQGPAVAVTSDMAETLAMALHELATNAGKYGALSNEAGTVALTWSVSETAVGTHTFAVAWTERGEPPVESPQSRGFGTSMIERMAKVDLDAEVSLAFDPAGLEWRLSCSFVPPDLPNAALAHGSERSRTAFVPSARHDGGSEGAGRKP